MRVYAISSGSTKDLERFLKKAANTDYRALLEKFGQRGVNALSSDTPTETGKASTSWYYKVDKTKRGWSITWYNSDVENGFPVAVMLQYGHATGGGGWVEGTDYINPAMRPIFDQIAKDAWKAVTSA